MAGFAYKRKAGFGGYGGKRKKYMYRRRRYQARGWVKQFPLGIASAARLDTPGSAYMSGVCKMCRSWETTLSMATGTQGATGYAFTMSQVLNIGELQAVFDQYMIVGIKVLMIPRFTSAEVGAAKELEWPKVYVWYDCDDATPPSAGTAISAAMQRSNVQQLDLTRPNEFYFKPRLAPQFYNGGFGTSSNYQWINMASIGIEYYGLKIAWSSGGASGDTNYLDLTFKYYMRFKYGQ